MRVNNGLYDCPKVSKDTRKYILSVKNQQTLLMQQGADKVIRVVPLEGNEYLSWKKVKIVGGKYLRAARYLAAKEAALRAAKYFTPKN